MRPGGSSMSARRSKPRKKKAPARRSAARKRSRPKASRARRPAAKRGARKPATRAAKALAAPAAALAALVRRIVHATQDPSAFSLRELYAEGPASPEANGHVATGLDELEAKLAHWNSVQDRSEWTPRRIFADGDAICIEWDATVHMRDGRVVPLSEVAIHQVRDGRIVAERFYYDPKALAPRPA